MSNDLHEKRNALLEAIHSGARKIEFRSGGTTRSVEYNSFEEMNASLRYLEAQIVRENRIRTFKPFFSKSF